ncbi:MAG: TonB-dependent receptor, partial [Bacteroidota bacterium]
MKKSIQLLIGSLLLLLTTAKLTAQNGTVRGTVSDKATGEALMFSNVLVKGSDPVVGTQTDLDGNYELKLAAGKYDLEFSYVGYTTQTVTGLEVKDGEITVFDFLMSSDAIELDLDIVVSAERIDRTENALLVLQMKAPAIQDGISAQEISRYGSSNAAESMKRVTGASVQDGKYIVVRGLGDRYSNAQLNGQQLPSTDPYRNSTQLDLIPANLLDNVVASKTFTPDMPGNFTGGNVNIKTKSFPERFTLSASVSSSYNTQSSLIDNFLTHEGGSTDWLGYDDGSRDIPAILQDPNTRQELKASSFIFGPRDEELGRLIDESARGLSPELDPSTTSTPMNHGISFSVGNQFNVADKPLGVLFGVNYSRSFSHYGDGRFQNWEVNPGGEELVNNLALDDVRSVDNPTIGGLLGLAYKFTPTNKVSLNVLYNHDGTKLSRSLEGAYPAIISGSGTFQTRSIQFIEREIASFQLNGEHILGKNKDKNGIQFDWAGSFTMTGQDEPDFRLFANTFRVRDNGDVQYFISPAEYDLPFHFFRELNEEQIQFKGDFTIPFAQQASTANKLKFGANFRTKDRSFEEDQWQIINFDNIAPYDGTGTDFFRENSGMLTEEGSTNQTVGLYPISQRDISNSYDGTESVFAAYGMVTLDLDRFKIIGGVRLENTDITVESRDTNFDVGNIQQLDVLPSLNIVYRLTEKMNLRASATQTLARPNMRELAPFTSFDLIGGFRITGNPNLERTLVQNYDVRWEYYPNPGEVF